MNLVEACLCVLVLMFEVKGKKLCDERIFYFYVVQKGVFLFYVCLLVSRFLLFFYRRVLM